MTALSMTTMKKFFAGTVGLMALAMAAPAFAADLPAQAPATYTKAAEPLYDWSGFYLGINLGGGWSHNCWTNTSFLGVATVPGFGEGCNTATGGLAGGQIGYRAQLSALVFGLEAQGNWANLSASNASLFNFGTTNQTNIDALALFTGQIGFTISDVLLYVKGGAALAHNTFNGLFAGVAFDQATETRFGSVVGTGIEVGFGPNWSFALEYDHAFMGSQNLTFTAVPVAGIARNDSISQSIDMVTARVDLHFGGPLVAKY
jgi:outer membrane immunogenic protein